jgi:hypothetical protein
MGTQQAYLRVRNRLTCGCSTGLLEDPQQAYLRVLNRLTCGYATGLVEGTQQAYLRVRNLRDAYVPGLGTGTSTGGGFTLFFSNFYKKRLPKLSLYERILPMSEKTALLGQYSLNNAPGTLVTTKPLFTLYPPPPPYYTDRYERRKIV